jgi:hypothetical protein
MASKTVCPKILRFFSGLFKKSKMAAGMKKPVKAAMHENYL